MRRVTVTSRRPVLTMPRGWIVVGAVIASWAIVALLWTGIGQTFMALLN